MYMAKAKKNSSKVITIVLMVAFGLLALVVGYATLIGGSFELRSKAATEEILLKQWTFDSGAQDWKASDWGKQSVGKGVYSLVIDTKTETRERKEVCTGTKKRGNYKCRQKTVVTQLEPRLERGAVDTTLLYPVNRFKMKLSVLAGVGSDPYAKKMRVLPVSFMVQYKLEGKNAFETPVPLKLTADGSMQEVVFEFPKELLRKKITDFKISFVDMKAMANTAIAVDQIQLVGYKEIPGKTVIGTVMKVSGDSPDGISKTGYTLRGYYEGQTTKNLIVFALMQGSDPAPCPPGRACPLIARRANINFEEFVNKEVIAVGSVAGPEGWRGTDDERRMLRERSMQVLYVNSMKLKNELPCQPIPAGCQDPSGQMLCKIALMEGYRWCQPTQPPKPQVIEAGCAVAGCSGELCVSEQQAASMGVSRCNYLASYACYKSATCEKQASGQCGWTMNQELAACIESASGPDYVEYRMGSRGSSMPPAPAGCSYQQVQCVRAPCDPVLVCPTP